MEQPNQFRSAFNGFNREDVVRYMEFINNKHAAQVAQLNNELEYLRSRQDTLDAGRVADLERQLSEADSRIQELQERADSLERQLVEAHETLSRRPDRPAPAAPAAQPASSQELEAYRRAERVERVAKERAKQISTQTGTSLAAASEKIEGISGQLAELVGQVVEQMSLLQSAVDSGAQAFRDAQTDVEKLNAEIEE